MSRMDWLMPDAINSVIGISGGKNGVHFVRGRPIAKTGPV